jgi:hypothetical protein
MISLLNLFNLTLPDNTPFKVRRLASTVLLNAFFSLGLVANHAIDFSLPTVVYNLQWTF